MNPSPYLVDGVILYDEARLYSDEEFGALMIKAGKEFERLPNIYKYK